MIWKTVIFLGFALCVFGDGHHATSEQYIKINHKDHHGHHGELSHIGSKKPEHHEEYAWSYPSYEFSYSVDDPHTHDKKGQKESREGDAVKGEYWLIQPDGRKRTVTYHADKHSGFQADVHYSDHHHDVYEHHGYGKDEHKDEDEDDKGYSKEKVEEKEEKKKESSEESNEESSEESSEEEEGRGAEESRGRQGGAIRWGYGPKWDHEIPKVHKEYRVRESHKDDHDDKHANFGGIHIIRNVGTYSHRDSKKHGRDEGHEESLLWEERRKFDERRGYPSHSTPYYGHASRINPRFQPQIQRHQRRIPSRT